MTNRIKNTFNNKSGFSCAALLSCLLIAACSSQLYGLAEQKHPYLTENETRLSKSIFGNEINPSIVKKHLEPRELCSYTFEDFEVTSSNCKIATTTSKKDIHFHGHRNHSEDYGATLDAYLFATFVHEMTHIWQLQNSFASTAHSCTTYHYDLFENKGFDGYCDEEQAAIMGDYALRFLRISPVQSKRLSDLYGKDTEKTDAALKNLVEKRFPQAKKERLSVEKQRQNYKKYASKTYHPVDFYSTKSLNITR